MAGPGIPSVVTRGHLRPRRHQCLIASSVMWRDSFIMTLTTRTHMVDMQVIVRLQDRGALGLDHLHDQALCEPEGRGDLSITHIMPRFVRPATRGGRVAPAFCS